MRQQIRRDLAIEQQDVRLGDVALREHQLGDVSELQLVYRRRVRRRVHAPRDPRGRFVTTSAADEVSSEPPGRILTLHAVQGISTAGDLSRDQMAKAGAGSGPPPEITRFGS